MSTETRTPLTDEVLAQGRARMLVEAIPTGDGGLTLRLSDDAAGTLEWALGVALEDVTLPAERRATFDNILAKLRRQRAAAAPAH